MFNRNLTSLAVGAVLAMGSASAYALASAGTGHAASTLGQFTAQIERAGAPGVPEVRGQDLFAAKGSGRRKPRVPGGSGCDDPEDLIEHPECAGNAALAADLLAAKGSGRGKPRVPGGSGCDDPEDLIEHPECRANIMPGDDQLARRKPRVPGGSGCDDPEDLIEHPECRATNVTQGMRVIAREASEGPRGADNERPGDRQRRGGRGRG